MSNKNRYFYYTLWLIGALVWLYIGDQIYEFYEQKSKQFFEMRGLLYASSIIHVIDGLYLGTLVLFGRKFKMNIPLLLIITIPTFLLGILPSVRFVTGDTFHLGASFYQYLSEEYLLRIFGLSLMLGLFSKNKNQSR